MHIECPSCATENKIEYGDNILCCECNKSFGGYSYKKFKKPFISTTAALFIGVFGTYKAEQIFFDDQRYPLIVEYEIIDGCINSSRTLRTSQEQINRTQVCVCALGKTMKEFSYKESQKSESKFLTRLRSNIFSCN